MPEDLAYGEEAGTARGVDDVARRLVTIADVAREAGVHPSTVSRVLNGRAKVRMTTQERIKAAARRLNYHPSHSARGLASRRSMVVGVLLPDLRNLMHADFLQGAQDLLQPRGYSLFICDGRLDPAVQAAELNRFLELRVDAVIVTRSFTMMDLLTPFIEAGIPVEPVELLQAPHPEALRQLRDGSLAAFRHLLDLGHRRFAFFVLERRDAPRRSAEMQGRIGSLMQAAAERGLPKSAIELVPVREPADCVREVARLAASPDPPTAMIGGNDWVTAPMLAAIGALGLRIPQDVSVVSYGDSRWAEAYRPPLSVIRYDYRAEGSAIACRVLARLGVENRHGDATSRGLARDEFVLRQSCAPVPLPSA